LRHRVETRDAMMSSVTLTIIIFGPKCQSPSKTRTDGRTDRQTPGIEFGASVTSGGNNFNEFPDN